MNCPNCSATTAERSLPRAHGQAVHIDVCERCHGIWFDDLEFLQITPSATLDLFREIQAAQAGPRQPLAGRLTCPRCRGALRLANDMQRATRFSYFKCARGHGRFITYYQFLRAKNFVRSLNAKEIEELRRYVRQVNCTNCGAPVNVDRDVACGFCRTPVSILDPDQLSKAVAQLRQAAAPRAVDPAWPLRVVAERRRAERELAGLPDGGSLLDLIQGDAQPDLVTLGLRAIEGLFRR